MIECVSFSAEAPRFLISVISICFPDAFAPVANTLTTNRTSIKECLIVFICPPEMRTVLGPNEGPIARLPRLADGPSLRCPLSDRQASEGNLCRCNFGQLSTRVSFQVPEGTRGKC